MYLNQNMQNLPCRTQEKEVGGLFLIQRLYWKNERLQRKRVFVNVSKMAYMLKIGKIFHIHT